MDMAMHSSVGVLNNQQRYVDVISRIEMLTMKTLRLLHVVFHV